MSIARSGGRRTMDRSRTKPSADVWPSTAR
jgi:hypothetical protein